MRKLIGILFCVGVLFFVMPNDTYAQGKSKSNNGRGEQASKQQGPPPWAPAKGYRAKTRYVYFKDYDVYYDHNKGVYITLSGKNWSVSTKLPAILSRVDLITAVKVDLDFDGDEPQKYHNDHTKKYPKKKK